MAKVLILAGDAAESLEVMYPYQRLKEEGYEVHIAAPSKKQLHFVVHDFEEGYDTYTEKPGYSWPADLSFKDVTPEEYVALVIGRARGVRGVPRSRARGPTPGHPPVSDPGLPAIPELRFRHLGPGAQETDRAVELEPPEGLERSKLDRIGLERRLRQRHTVGRRRERREPNLHDHPHRRPTPPPGPPPPPPRGGAAAAPPPAPPAPP